MRVVVDTNIFVTALLHGKTPRRVYEAFLSGKLTPVFSAETLAELIDVLTRPSLRVLMTHGEGERFLSLIQRDGIITSPKHRVLDCRDIKDNMFLECALAGVAECIVTGDGDLLALHPYHGIPILRPSEFLKRLP